VTTPGDEDIGGLNVPVDDASGVGGFQRIGYGDRQ
jgi:hypothetical protein